MQRLDVMKWHKSPDALVQAFDHCLPVVPGVERKAMFGYPCAFLNGHLFCGLHQDGIIVRLPKGRRDKLLSHGASVFEPIPGQATKEYVVAPVKIVADRARLRSLLSEALTHASSLGRRPKSSKKPSATHTKRATPKRKAAPPRKVVAARKPPVRKTAPAKPRRPASRAKKGSR